MGIFDIIIASVLVISVLIGVVRGFVKELLSLVAWIIAFWLSFRFANILSVYFDPYISSPAAKVLAAFVLIFIITLLLVSIANYFIYKLFSVTGLTGTDRSLGFIFGFVRGVVVVAAFVLFANVLAVRQQPWWQQSLLIPYFYPVAEMIRDVLPANVSQQLRPK